MSVAFGVQPRHLSPVARKIEQSVAAKAIERKKAEILALQQDLDRMEGELADKASRISERRDNIRRRAHPRRYIRASEAKLERRLYEAAKKRPTSALIMREVAEQYGLSVQQLLSQRRTRNLTVPRREAMWRMFEETQLSLPAIGLRMGGRDHTTILHGIVSYMAEHGVPMPEHRKRLQKYGSNRKPERKGPP